MSRVGKPPRTAREAASPPPAPLGEAQIDELQSLLDGVPAPLEPPDVVMLDGWLCAVLLQPAPVARERWLPFATDVDGRALPRGVDARRLQALVLQRESELRRAIDRRAWFDPWVFELGGDADGDAAAAVLPWAAGFAAALGHFPALLQHLGESANEALALVLRHVDAETLDDADELLLEIEAIGPAADLADAVEGLVRATLLLADAAGLPRSKR